MGQAILELLGHLGISIIRWHVKRVDHVWADMTPIAHTFVYALQAGRWDPIRMSLVLEDAQSCPIQ